MDRNGENVPTRTETVKKRRRILLLIIVALFVTLVFLIMGLSNTVYEAHIASSITPSATPTLYVRITKTPTPIPTCTPTPGPVVVIDAGHGGKDVGTDLQGNADVVEKEINLLIAKEVQNNLCEKGFTVIMTRNSDVSVSDEDRLQTAASSGAKVMISIHLNAVSLDLSDVYGCEAYYNDKKDKNAKLLAENIVSEICKQTGTKDRGVKTGSFDVLKADAPPTVIIECGFMSSATEYEALKDPEYRKKLAEGIAEGLIKYLKKTDGD